MHLKYKLDENNNVVPCSREEWNALFDTAEANKKRYVAYDVIGAFEVSTVFIGFDWHFRRENNPFVFETMIFDKGNQGLYTNRYPTWEEAEKGHQEAINWLKFEILNIIGL